LSQEELFNHCLSELESSNSIGQPTLLTGARDPKEIPISILHLTQPPTDPFLLSQVCINCSRFDVIKVMNSGIFYKGGLKGRSLTMNNQDYVVYYFKDLVYSILRATSYLVREKPGEYLRYYISAFDRAINQIDTLKSIISTYNLNKRSEKMDEMKEYLEKTKSIIVGKPVITLSHRYRDTIYGQEDCVDSLIRLFKQQLPTDTPKNIISKAISTLLALFNIFFIGEAGIRQRMTRANQK